MKIDSGRVLKLALLLSAVLTFTQCVRSQTGPVLTTRVERSHPAWEGKAAGAAPTFQPTSNYSSTALLTQEIPNIWLEFNNTQRKVVASAAHDTALIKVALPEEAKAVLKSFWSETLKFSYEENFIKPKSAQVTFDRKSGWLRTYTTSVQGLARFEIAAPDGNRQISEAEAESILNFASAAASRLARQTEK